MIDELKVDWTSLTKADLYTIIKQAEDENAKLRALCINMYCEFVLPYGDVDARHEYADRMCELGVEVE